MRVVCALIVAALLMTATPARGEYPDKPVEIVVPFVAGGGTDLISRLVADYLGRRWNQPLLVVNKPGGGGIPGARAALKDARPDGYTALMDIHTTSSMHIGAWKTPQLTLADRKYAGRIVRDPMVFAVKADAPWKSFRELSDWVKANPGELVWSSVGPSGRTRPDSNWLIAETVFRTRSASSVFVRPRISRAKVSRAGVKRRDAV